MRGRAEPSRLVSILIDLHREILIMFNVGLTGGIGSGKSTVAKRLVELGALLVDTDAISKTLTGPGGKAILRIRELFTNGAVQADGSLNRSFIRDLVFHDQKAKQRLESVLHPMIKEEAERQACAAGRSQAVVFDVPLLADNPQYWIDRCAYILVVDCSVETQVQRVMLRSGWSEETVRNVITKQASRENRLKIATDVIVNDELSINELYTEVDKVWAGWWR